MPIKPGNDFYKYRVVAVGLNVDGEQQVFMAVSHTMPKAEAQAYLEWLESGISRIHAIIRDDLFKVTYVRKIIFCLEAI